MEVVWGFEQFRDRGKEQLLNGLADNHSKQVAPRHLLCHRTYQQGRFPDTEHSPVWP